MKKKYQEIWIYLIGHSIEASDLWESEVPRSVGRSVDILRIDQRLRIVKPVSDRFVLVIVELNLKNDERKCCFSISSVLEFFDSVM